MTSHKKNKSIERCRGQLSKSSEVRTLVLTEMNLVFRSRAVSSNMLPQNYYFRIRLLHHKNPLNLLYSIFISSITNSQTRKKLQTFFSELPDQTFLNFCTFFNLFCYNMNNVWRSKAVFYFKYSPYYSLTLHSKNISV